MRTLFQGSSKIPLCSFRTELGVSLLVAFLSVFYYIHLHEVIVDSKFFQVILTSVHSSKFFQIKSETNRTVLRIMA